MEEEKNNILFIVTREWTRKREVVSEYLTDAFETVPLQYENHDIKFS